MTHGSLFSGIGGFDLAAQWMGWTNVFHCEIAEFPRQILKYHFPESISYDDITKTDFTIHRGSIDIISGGFPCQPFSLAGKRLGKDDERYLWGEMLRAIREIQPKWVVGENVLGIVNWSDGLVFEEVCADLEAEGYEVQPYLLPAASTNAPHQRMRCWFVAHARKFRLELGTASRTMGKGQGEICGEGGEPTLQSSATSKTGDAAHPDGIGLRTQGDRLGDAELIDKIGKDRDWGDFPVEPPLCGGNDGISSELDSIAFSKWRQESIKAYGNAVVPQLVYRIFDTIQQYENI